MVEKGAKPFLPQLTKGKMRKYLPKKKLKVNSEKTSPKGWWEDANAQ